MRKTIFLILLSPILWNNVVFAKHFEVIINNQFNSTKGINITQEPTYTDYLSKTIEYNGVSTTEVYLKPKDLCKLIIDDSRERQIYKITCYGHLDMEVSFEYSESTGKVRCFYNKKLRYECRVKGDDIGDGSAYFSVCIF